MGSNQTHRKKVTEGMQRNKRMARTLACLVASMTVGAALLDWVQPKPARSLAMAAHTELMSLVQQGTSAPGVWRGIQLDPQSPDKTTAGSHFVINTEGQASPTPLWRQQRPLGSRGIVRIGLVASDNSNQVTPAQWTKATELVQAIQNECLIPAEQIHYDMLAVPAAPQPAQSRRAPAPTRSSRHK